MSDEQFLTSPFLPRFHLFSHIFSWLTLGGIILGTIGFLWAGLLHLRYRSLYMLTLTRLPTTSALPTLPWEVVFTRATTTTSSRKYDFYDIQQELINILPVDLTLLFLVAVCVRVFRLSCCPALQEPPQEQDISVRTGLR